MIANADQKIGDQLTLFKIQCVGRIAENDNPMTREDRIQALEKTLFGKQTLPIALESLPAPYSAALPDWSSTFQRMLRKLLHHH